MTMILREDIFDHFNFTIPTRKELVALINYVIYSLLKRGTSC